MKRTLILLITAILTVTLFTGCDAEKNKNDNSQTDASAINTVYPVDCTASLLNEKQAKYLNIMSYFQEDKRNVENQLQ